MKWSILLFSLVAIQVHADIKCHEMDMGKGYADLKICDLGDYQFLIETNMNNSGGSKILFIRHGSIDINNLPQKVTNE